MIYDEVDEADSYTTNNERHDQYSSSIHNIGDM